MTYPVDKPSVAQAGASEAQTAPASTVTFHVPGPPVGKGRPRASTVNGHARLYTPGKTRDYEARVALAAERAMEGRTAFDGPVSVTFEAVFQIPKWSKRKVAAALAGDIVPTTKPDWDNIAKTSDALNGIVWRDDKQVADGRVVKRYGETPGVWITVVAYEARP